VPAESSTGCRVDGGRHPELCQQSPVGRRQPSASLDEVGAALDRAAERLGTNSSPIAEALRRLAFPDAPSGAAHVRWPDGTARPVSGPFGVLVAARQSVRWQGGSYVEVGAASHVRIVDLDGVGNYDAEQGPRLAE